MRSEDYIDEPHLPVVFVLEDVRSGNNVGSFFRTGDAFCISGVELCGISLEEWKPKKGEKWALVFGNEVRGVKPTTCDSANILLEIPQLGVKNSMNVSVCAGIVLWHASQGMRVG